MIAARASTHSLEGGAPHVRGHKSPMAPTEQCVRRVSRASSLLPATTAAPTAQVARTLGPVHKVVARACITKRAFVSVGTIAGGISDHVSATVLIITTGPCTNASRAAEEALEYDIR